MKNLSCRWNGECPWAVNGNDDAEVLRAAREHARRYHRHELTPDDESLLRHRVVTM